MFSVRPQHCQPGNNLPPEPPVCQAGLGIRLPRLNCLPSRAGRQTRPLPRASLSLRRRAAATSPRPWWTTTTMSPAKGKTQNGTSTAACNELYNRFTSQSTKACCKSKLSLFYWKYLCQKLYTSLPQLHQILWGQRVVAVQKKGQALHFARSISRILLRNVIDFCLSAVVIRFFSIYYIIKNMSTGLFIRKVSNLLTRIYKTPRLIICFKVSRILSFGFKLSHLRNRVRKLLLLTEWRKTLYVFHIAHSNMWGQAFFGCENAKELTHK